MDYRERGQIVSSSIANEDDELSLTDIWRVLSRQKKWAVGFPLLLGLAGIVFVLLAKPEWEASAVIQIGQIWQIGSDQSKQLIEPAPRAIERMKVQGFENDVLKSLKLPLDENDPLASLYRGSLRLKLLPNTDLIELRVRGLSPEDAVKYAEATVAHLRSVHVQLATPSIEKLNRLLADAKNDRKRIQEERATMMSNLTLKEQIGPGNRFAENVLLADILASKDAEIRDLQQRILSLEEQLNPAKTYPTSLIDSAYVPTKPVFPRKVLTVVLAVLVGFVLGFIAAFVADYFARQRAVSR